MSGTPVSHEAKGRSPLMFGADASNESARRGNLIRQILSVVLVLNLTVAGAKLGYGFVCGSVAMLADGFHSLLDGFANVVGIVGIGVEARPPDQEHHFGHGRYETLASMAIGALMAVGVLEIVQSAIGRWQSGKTPQVTRLSFGVMLGTMASNAGLTIWERRAARGLHSDLLEADARHTGSDVLVSAAVVTAPGAITAHNLRVRSSGGRNWVEVHVTVDPDLTVKQAHEVTTQVESAIRNVVGPETQAIVHVEPAEPPHMRPDPIFGHDFQLTTDEATGAERVRRPREGIR